MSIVNRKNIPLIIPLIFISLNCPGGTFSQKTSPLEKLSLTEIDYYKKNITRLISFLEFSMNIVGSDSTTVEEKEAVISTSYSKIFKDSKTLIEDDLDQNRKQPVYKTVQAYLRDIDYFFIKAKFHFEIESIDYVKNEDGYSFFKATLNSELQAITIENDTIEIAQKRFIELNPDTKNKEVKIVSIYTTRFREEDEQKLWWNNLPLDWQLILKKEAAINDSVDNLSLKKIILLEKINLSNNKNIIEIEPLSRLTELNTVDLSGTHINDLSPLHNLTKIKILSLNNTPITTLLPLIYLHQLRELYINNTNVYNIEPVRYFEKLEKLYCSGAFISELDSLCCLKHLEELDCSNTEVYSINPLKNLTNLKVLNLSNTRIKNFDVLSSLVNLKNLYLSNTIIKNLEPIGNLKYLTLLSINNTMIDGLGALQNIATLKKIYCDNTNVSPEEAIHYMQYHHGVLVMYQSDGLIKWWNGLSKEWEKIFRKRIQFDNIPTKEQLAAITNIDSLNISGNKEITNLSPLKSMLNLKILRINNTKISSLEPLENIHSLEVVEFEGTLVASFKGIEDSKELTLINCEGAPIENSEIEQLIANHHNCLVIYKSAELYRWWSNLDDEWKSVFQNHIPLGKSPNSSQLHQLVRLDSINIESIKIKDLKPLSEFHELRFLRFSNTHIETLTTLINYSTLRVLEFPANPINDLSPLINKANLEFIDCSNTAVKDLTPLNGMKKLISLKCSGSRIKDLAPLINLAKLQFIDISNTKVRNLSPLNNFKSIKTLVCYNTAISKKKIESFTKMNPHCTITYY